jgi:phospholipase/carboxylesterase
MADVGENEATWLRAALAAAEEARSFLGWMEVVAERLAPDRSRDLAAETERRHGERLASRVTALDAVAAPDELAPFAERLRSGLRHVERAFALFTSFPSAPPGERIPWILGALHERARADAEFYALRLALPPFRDYWGAPGGSPEEPRDRDAAGPSVGVVHVSAGGHHGGFALYVPETYEADRDWPLVVALHGGSGNGPDFLWTWVREAKSRGYLLVAPSSAGQTWGEVDDLGIREILGWIADRYRVDRGRVLLTGLSDGATFGLLYGLLHPDVYRAIAPLCGVFHPAHEPLGNLGRAAGVPIYQVHGALDFLFPVDLARYQADVLRRAGALLEYRELAELSHTYPRSENVRILDWFESLPPRKDA